MTWLGDNANSATNELAWYPPPAVERKAPASHEKDAFGEPEMLALMALRNPMMMSVISQLQRMALSGTWNLRVAAAHALGKIAVMSDEPFRFHCYVLLRALSGESANDPLGALFIKFSTNYLACPLKQQPLLQCESALVSSVLPGGVRAVA